MIGGFRKRTRVSHSNSNVDRHIAIRRLTHEDGYEKRTAIGSSSQPGHSQSSGVIATHSVHAPAGRRRSRTEIDVACRCRVPPPGGTKQDLPQIHRSATDVSADKIGIHFFKCRGRKNPPCENAVAESGCEPLNLTFQSAQHIEARTIRDMAVSPHSMSAFWRARGVKQTGL